MILRARIVVPVSTPLIENGALVIDGGRIIAVAPWAEIAGRFKGTICDLGEVILLPGLVNAHCHLDYTNLAGEIGTTSSFIDWIKSITTLKMGMDRADFMASWSRGAQMLLRTGTTTVADIEAVPELLPEAWQSTPLRIYSFLEMTGIKSRREPGQILDEACSKIESLRPSRNQMGLSPHASYSTQFELLLLSGVRARQQSLRLATHVAESAEEFEMFFHKRGSMFDFLLANNRVMDDCGGITPVGHLERAGILGKNLIAVHANYLHEKDAERLAQSGSHIVHCPRSHTFFRHRPFPFLELKTAGTNICLGTDSLASVDKLRGQDIQLNMFEEMSAFAKSNPSVSPDTILKLATMNGALALGMKGAVGELTIGACADIIAIPYSGGIADSHEAIISHSGDVAASMIDGQWALRPESLSANE